MARSQLLDWDVTPEPEPQDPPDVAPGRTATAAQPGTPESMFERYTGAFRALRAEASDVSSGSVLR